MKEEDDAAERLYFSDSVLIILIDWSKNLLSMFYVINNIEILIIKTKKLCQLNKKENHIINLIIKSYNF